MEALWWSAGFVIGVVVCWLAGARNQTTVRKPVDYDDREIGRLEIEERLEKLDRMIDRYRKRASVPQEARQESFDGQPNMRDQLRAKARALGLLKGV